MKTILKIEPVSEAQMSERVKTYPLGVAISRDRHSLSFPNGEQWVFDKRFTHWVCTQPAREVTP